MCFVQFVLEFEIIFETLNETFCSEFSPFHPCSTVVFLPPVSQTGLFFRHYLAII